MEEKKENKIWLFIKKHIKPKTIVYIVIVLAIAGLAFGVGKEFNTESKTTKLGFEDIGELATQVAYCSEVNVTDESRDIYGIKIPFTQTKYVYSYDVEIKAGFDFSDITCDINENNKTVSFTMPQPKILSNEIDLDSLKVYHEAESIFNNITLDENNKALQSLKEKAEQPFITNVIRNYQVDINIIQGKVVQTQEGGYGSLYVQLTGLEIIPALNYLKEVGIKVKYLHSDIVTLERTEIIRDLRLGKFDVLVGINLLREGLDIPEVSLIAILDADKEGFLRSETSLIQTVGRAARNAEGRVIMYADKITRSMSATIEETARRRQIQSQYNEEHGIIPRTIKKDIRDNIETLKLAEEEEIYGISETDNKDEIKENIEKLQAEMMEAATNLQFERAAQLRDKIKELEEKLQK